MADDEEPEDDPEPDIPDDELDPEPDIPDDEHDAEPDIPDDEDDPGTVKGSKSPTVSKTLSAGTRSDRSRSGSVGKSSSSITSPNMIIDEEIPESLEDKLSKSQQELSKLDDTGLSDKKTSLDHLSADRVQRGKKTHRQCHRRFREIIGKRELKNEELEKQTGDLQQRLNILECSMPAVMVWNIWRMTQGTSPPCLKRILEKQFEGPASGEVYCPSTPSRHFDCRVREKEAERKQALKRVEEARTLWAEKVATLEDRHKRLEEAKRIQAETKEKIQQLTAESQRLKDALPKEPGDGECEAGECGVIECKKKWLERVPSNASIKTADLECLQRLQELAETELAMKRQIADLERREEAYMRTLQQADELWCRLEGDAASTMSALQEQLDQKAAANLKMADRICELEDVIEKLMERLSNCRGELEKYVSVTKIEAMIGRDDDFAEILDKEVTASAELKERMIGVDGELVGVRERGLMAKARMGDAQMGIHPEDFAYEDERLQEAADYLARLGSLSELDKCPDDFICDFSCNNVVLTETGLTDEEMKALEENRVTVRMLMEKTGMDVDAELAKVRESLKKEKVSIKTKATVEVRKETDVAEEESEETDGEFEEAEMGEEEYKVVDKEAEDLGEIEKVAEEKRIIAEEAEEVEDEGATAEEAEEDVPDSKVIEDEVDEVVEHEIDKGVRDEVDEVVKDKVDEVAKDKVDEVVKDKVDDVIKDKVDDVIKDKVDEVVKDKVDDVIKDKVDEVVKDKVERVVKDEADEVVKDKVEKVVKDEVEEVVKDKVERVVKDEVEEVVKDKAERVAKDEVEEVVKDKVERVAKDEVEEVVKDKVERVVKDEVEEVVKDKVERVAKDEVEEVVKDKVERVVKDEVEEVVKDKVDIVVKDEVVKDKVDEVAKDEVDRVVKDEVVKDKVDRVVKDKVDEVVKDDVDTIAKDEVHDVVKDKVDRVVKDKVDEVVKDDVDTVAKDEVREVVKDKVDRVVKEDVDQVVKDEVPVAEEIEAKAAEKIAVPAAPDEKPELIPPADVEVEAEKVFEEAKGAIVTEIVDVATEPGAIVADENNILVPRDEMMTWKDDVDLIRSTVAQCSNCVLVKKDADKLATRLAMLTGTKMTETPEAVVKTLDEVKVPKSDAEMVAEEEPSDTPKADEIKGEEEVETEELKKELEEVKEGVETEKLTKGLEEVEEGETELEAAPVEHKGEEALGEELLAPEEIEQEPKEEKDKVISVEIEEKKEIIPVEVLSEEEAIEPTKVKEKREEERIERKKRDGQKVLVPPKARESQESISVEGETICSCKPSIEMPPTAVPKPTRKFEITQTEITRIETIQVITQTTEDIGTQTLPAPAIFRQTGSPRIVTTTRTLEADSEMMERILIPRKPPDAQIITTSITESSHRFVATSFPIRTREAPPPASSRRTGGVQKPGPEREIRSILYSKKSDVAEEGKCNCCLCAETTSSMLDAPKSEYDTQESDTFFKFLSTLPTLKKTCFQSVDKQEDTVTSQGPSQKPFKKVSRDQGVCTCGPPCLKGQKLQKVKQRSDQSCMAKIPKIKPERVSKKKECVKENVDSEKYQCPCSTVLETHVPGVQTKIHCACGDLD